MLPNERNGTGGPLLVMLHWLGGGAQTWLEVRHGLAARGVRTAAIDLPGFGNAAGTAGYGVAAMADAVAVTIVEIRGSLPEGTPWLLAGHSMGGKVAAVLSRRAADGDTRLEGLRGLVLVSPSPPGPEPMPGGKREETLDLLGETTGDAAKDRTLAAKFVDDNTGKLALLGDVRERAIGGVLAMNRTALRCWMTSGSKEDWADVVGTLALPALLFAGTEDGALGPEAQRKYSMPHLAHGELVILEGASHLSPLSRPLELVEHITRFVSGLGLVMPTRDTAAGGGFGQLLESDRVSPKTRAVMQARLAVSQTWNAIPQSLSAAEFSTLRALVERVVPEAGFDLAALIDRQLASDQDDGWRFDTLPPDAEAWRRGVLSLNLAARHAHDVSFLSLHAEQQDELLQRAADGKLGRGLFGSLKLGAAAHAYSADEMKSWFEDVRAVVTRLYVADPRTMERIGFTGFADDRGFTQIQLGQQEELER